MTNTLKTPVWLNWSWLIPWLLLGTAIIIYIPGLTMHITYRYFRIAYHMMSSHNYILPYWQGHPYTDKPALIFWLYTGGWHLFGVNNWWPQLLMLLFATGTLLSTRALVGELWPEKPIIKMITPFILLGFFNWSLFSQQMEVDPLLTFFCMLSWLALIRSIAAKPYSWLLFGLATGLGLLSKGPVIFVFCLLPALCLPLFFQIQQKRRWYFQLLLTTLMGIGIALLWAIPAMIQGGAHYTHEILFGQITNREAHFHGSLFFYLRHLPLWLLPWLFYVPLWLGLKHLQQSQYQASEKCILTIIVVGLIVFSLFAQKNPHYIYPLYPFFAIAIARILACYPNNKQWPLRASQRLLGIGLLFVAGILFLAIQKPLLFPVVLQDKYSYIRELSLGYPALLVVVAGCLFFLRPKRLAQSLALFLCGIIALNIVQYCALPNLRHQTNVLMQKDSLWFLGGYTENYGHEHKS